MTHPDDKKIAAAISKATGKKADITAQRVISGGSINHARQITLADGRHYFVKTHPMSHRYPGMFKTELLGLQRLHEAGTVASTAAAANADTSASTSTIRVPQPLMATESFIIMEYIEQGSPAADWKVRIGEALALLHQNTQQPNFGFDRDNYLGTTPQINTWTDNWPEFWRERRLNPQLQLYAKQAAANDPLLSLGETLAAKLEDILADCNEPAVLLHGDLWSGNAFADTDGNPVIVDPACYYGQREAEIGMMRMFGGFGPTCEQAYNKVWPLQAGAERRITLYRLHHELNHLNLFGSTYYESCLASMRALL
ncbi:MAG: fructosamine kinase family protein [Pseudohongiellaceae bacterium]